MKNMHISPIQEGIEQGFDQEDSTEIATQVENPIVT
jgi:hypothetical protein